jgi:hypothetical protein
MAFSGEPQSLGLAAFKRSRPACICRNYSVIGVRLTETNRVGVSFWFDEYGQ